MQLSCTYMYNVSNLYINLCTEFYAWRLTTYVCTNSSVGIIMYIFHTVCATTVQVAREQVEYFCLFWTTCASVASGDHHLWLSVPVAGMKNTTTTASCWSSGQPSTTCSGGHQHLHRLKREAAMCAGGSLCSGADVLTCRWCTYCLLSTGASHLHPLAFMHLHFCSAIHNSKSCMSISVSLNGYMPCNGWQTTVGLGETISDIFDSIWFFCARL